jgi:hypothetical protein
MGALVLCTTWALGSELVNGGAAVRSQMKDADRWRTNTPAITTCRVVYPDLLFNDGGNNDVVDVPFEKLPNWP